MINWFLSLIDLRREAARPKETPKTRSVNDGDPLTQWELDFLIAHEGQKCPDCEKGRLLFIAEASGMLYVRCELCQAELNIADGGMFHGTRLEVGKTNFDPQTYRG